MPNFPMIGNQSEMGAERRVLEGEEKGRIKYKREKRNDIREMRKRRDV